MRTVLTVEMELLSNTILSSGYSTPGGEDIAVCTDSKGYPYLKGSTFKGLLRESAENLIAWNNLDEDYIKLLFGDSDWNGEAGEKRIQFTEMTLSTPPSHPEDCFDTRSFVELKDGVLLHGALRVAECILKGLKFNGEIVCDENDVPFLTLALKGIQYIGTSRNRGFGNVRFTVTKSSRECFGNEYQEGSCLRYRIELLSPLQITNAQLSDRNSFRTRHHISGSAIRGAVLSNLSQRHSDWFSKNRVKLLSDALRFSDALPIPDQYEEQLGIIPSPMGFYESADESSMESILSNGTHSLDKKRAKLGQFCQIKGEKIIYWDSQTDSSPRILCSKKSGYPSVFHTEYLCAGQVFEGYVHIDDPSLSTKVAECLGGIIWLGADRYQGFGKCRVSHQKVDFPLHIASYGININGDIPNTIYMLLLSPTALVNDTGAVCAINNEILSVLFGTKVEITNCATSVSDYKSYNRTWGCFSPTVRMYERGSVFRLSFENPPSARIIEKLQTEGIGIRRSEGFGQVLFLPRELIDGIGNKSQCNLTREDEVIWKDIILRREKIKWVINNADTLDSDKIGSLLMICEKSAFNGGDLSELRAFEESIKERNVIVREKYKRIFDFINNILDKSSGLPIVDHNSNAEKIALLCMLFNYKKMKGE